MVFTHSSTFPNFTCSFKPKKSHTTPNPKGPKPPTPPHIITTKKTILAIDQVIEFGKYRGKMLGTLPSTYLKWVSNNLRAGNTLHRAKLADQVLQDPVYKDRLEWEYADSVLNGNKNGSLLPRNDNDGTAVSNLLEISERFGWDNEDKVGWSKVNFELLGTSKSSRIPRKVLSSSPSTCASVKEEEREKADYRALSQNGQRRKERAERVRSKRGMEEKMGIVGKSRGSFGNEIGGVRDDGFRFDRKQQGSDDQDCAAEFNSPFPGRESLLKKVLNGKRFL